MRSINVQFHDGLCCGFGNCAGVCPEVFALDYVTNRVKLVPDAPMAVYTTQIAQAVSECPTQAIVMFQSSDGDRQSHA
ncbi:ferredoxin [Paraburkholderia sp.]|uniref:ferredoxin n=1 Tax=Paraburkholderia sp. TaxID=1926495 RepID=UPI003C7A3969